MAIKERRLHGTISRTSVLFREVKRNDREKNKRLYTTHVWNVLYNLDGNKYNPDTDYESLLAVFPIIHDVVRFAILLN